MFEAELDENNDPSSLLTWMKVRRNIYRNRQNVLQKACLKLNVSLVGTTFEPKNESGSFDCCHVLFLYAFTDVLTLSSKQGSQTPGPGAAFGQPKVLVRP
jgi:hypothetical protein